MYYLPTTLLLIAVGCAMIINTLRYVIIKRKNHLLINELIIGFLFIASGFLFPLMYSSHSPHISANTLNVLWLSTSVILIAMVVWSLLAITLQRGCGESYEVFCKRILSNHDGSLRKEMKRKALHLLPVVILFLFWFLALFLEANDILERWNLDKYNFALWCIATVGLGFGILFGIGDLVRLNNFHSLPNWARELYENRLQPKELGTYISSSPMVLALSFFVFAPFPLFFSVALISSVSDAVASIVGKRYGKHKFHEDSKKTVEGYVGGIVSTFIIVVATFWAFLPLYVVELPIILLLGAVASGCFFLVDALAENITDNILNPIVTGLGMIGILYLI